MFQTEVKLDKSHSTFTQFTLPLFYVCTFVWKVQKLKRKLKFSNYTHMLENGGHTIWIFFFLAIKQCIIKYFSHEHNTWPPLPYWLGSDKNNVKNKEKRNIYFLIHFTCLIEGNSTKVFMFSYVVPHLSIFHPMQGLLNITMWLLSVIWTCLYGILSTYSAAFIHYMLFMLCNT